MTQQQRSWMAGGMVAMLAAGVFAVVLFASQQSAASAQMPASSGDRFYLKLDGTGGESADQDHANELAVSSFDWSASRKDTSSAAAVKDLHIVMAVDKSMPYLMQKMFAHQRLGKAVLTARNGLGQDYMSWTFGDVIVSSFGIQGATDQGRPTISFTLSSSKVDVEYRYRTNNGGLSAAVKGSWAGQ